MSIPMIVEMWMRPFKKLAGFRGVGTKCAHDLLPAVTYNSRTLQELLAPSEVIFFDQTWKEIGTKRDLCNAIAKITGIEVRYISDSTSSVFVKGGQDLLSAASVAERMSWAAERQTTRTEDLAYCLLGIFDICMPMLYGEGARAFTRLQEEIMKVTDDSSLLTWGYQYPLQECPTDGSSILAPSPAHFKHCRGIANRMPEGFGWPSFMMSQRGLQASLPICTDQTHEHLVYGILGCGPSKSTEEKSFLALPLVSTRACHSWRQDEDPHEAEYLRPFWCRPVLVSKDFFKSAEFRTLTIRRPSARNKALRRLPFSVSLRATAPHSFDVLGMYPPQTFGGQFTSLSRNSAASTEQRKSRIWRRFKHREQKRPIEAVRWIGHREVGQRMIHAKIASVPLLVVIDYEAEVIDETEWPAWDYKVSCRVFELPREFSLELLHELAVTQGFGRLRKRKVSSRGNASLVKLKDDSETLIALEFKRIQKLVATTIIFITVLDASLVHQFEELSVQELQAYEHNSDQ